MVRRLSMDILILSYLYHTGIHSRVLQQRFGGWRDYKENARSKLYFHPSQVRQKYTWILRNSFVMGHLCLLPDGVGRHGYGSGLRGLLGHRAERQGLVHLVNLQSVHLLLLCSSTGRWGRGIRCRRCWLWGWFRLGGGQYLQWISSSMNKKEIGICQRNCWELSTARIIQKFVQDVNRWEAGGNEWSSFFSVEKHKSASVFVESDDHLFQVALFICVNRLLPQCFSCNLNWNRKIRPRGKPSYFGKRGVRGYSIWEIIFDTQLFRVQLFNWKYWHISSSRFNHSPDLKLNP